VYILVTGKQFEHFCLIKKIVHKNCALLVPVFLTTLIFKGFKGLQHFKFFDFIVVFAQILSATTVKNSLLFLLWISKLCLLNTPLAKI